MRPFLVPASADLAYSKGFEMTTKHTPGPWLIDYELDDLDSSASVLRIIDPASLDHPQGPLTIATVNVAAHAPHLDEPLANAALIARAPLLMRALRTALPLLEASYLDHDGTENGRAIFAGLELVREALSSVIISVDEVTHEA